MRTRDKERFTRITEKYIFATEIVRSFGLYSPNNSRPRYLHKCKLFFSSTVDNNLCRENVRRCFVVVFNKRRLNSRTSTMKDYVSFMCAFFFFLLLIVYFFSAWVEEKWKIRWHHLLLSQRPECWWIWCHQLFLIFLSAQREHGRGGGTQLNRDFRILCPFKKKITWSP